MRSATGRIQLGLLLGLLVCCEASRDLPTELTFDGVRLDHAKTWSSGDISGVVFVTPGQTLPLADLQIGILVSHQHDSGTQLHQWILEKYHAAGGVQWFESATSDEHCKTGMISEVVGALPRPFVSLVACRTGKAFSACAEVDERMDSNRASRCVTQVGCWEEVCFVQRSRRRAAIEAVLKDVVQTE
jgi:hypothetical protein